MAESDNFESVIEHLGNVFEDSVKIIKTEKQALDNKIKHLCQGVDVTKYQDMISKLEKDMEQLEVSHRAEKDSLMEQLQSFNSEKDALNEKIARLNVLQTDLKSLVGEQKTEQDKIEQYIELLKERNIKNTRKNRLKFLNMFSIIEILLKDMFEMFSSDAVAKFSASKMDLKNNIDTMYVAKLDRDILFNGCQKYAEKCQDLQEFVRVFENIIKLRKASITIFCLSEEIAEVGKIRNDILIAAGANTKKYDTDKSNERDVVEIYIRQDMLKSTGARPKKYDAAEVKDKSNEQDDVVEIDIRGEEDIQLAYITNKWLELKRRLKEEADAYMILFRTVGEDVLSKIAETTRKTEDLKKKLSALKVFAKITNFQECNKWAYKLMEKLNADLSKYSSSVKLMASRRVKSPTKQSQLSRQIEFIKASIEKLNELINATKGRREIDDHEKNIGKMLKDWQKLENDLGKVIIDVASEMIRFKSKVMKGGNLEDDGYQEILDIFRRKCSPKIAEEKEMYKEMTGAEGFDKKDEKPDKKDENSEEKDENPDDNPNVFNVSFTKMSNDYREMRKSLADTSADMLMAEETQAREIEELKKKIQNLKDSKDSEKVNLTKELKSTLDEKKNIDKEIETLKKELDKNKKQQLKTVPDNEKINLKKSLQNLEEEKRDLLKNISTLEDKNKGLLSKEDDLKKSLDDHQQLLKKLELSESEIQQERTKIEDDSKRFDELLLRLKTDEDKIETLKRENSNLKYEYDGKVFNLKTQLEKVEAEIIEVKSRNRSTLNPDQQLYRPIRETNDKDFNEAKDLLSEIESKISKILTDELVCAVCCCKINTAVRAACGDYFCEECVKNCSMRFIKCKKCGLRVFLATKATPIIDSITLELSECETKLNHFTETHNPQIASNAAATSLAFSPKFF